MNDPQSLNRYTYVQNNPLNFTDPRGLLGPCTGKPSDTDPGCTKHPPPGCIWLTTADNAQWAGQQCWSFEIVAGLTYFPPSGSGSGSNSGSTSAPAPNNQPTVSHCLGTAGKANGLQTGLDILSGIPLEGDIATTAQIAIASASTTLSTYHQDRSGTGASVTGLVTVFAGAAGVNIAKNGVKLISVAGTIASGVSVLNDIFGSNGWVATYTSCRNGTHP